MSEFPVSGILPKEEIQVSSLLAQHPHFDGRGQIIAVLDQGVDPGADGLRITTEGKPKVVDILDTTGSGDVDTSKEVKTESDDSNRKFITGLTGRKLYLPENWSNPSQTWNVGVIDLVNIFPCYLKSRMMKERKEKVWSPAFNDAVGKALKKQNDLDKTDVSQLENFLAKENAKEEVAHLKKLGTDWKNKYFRTDLIIWNDGEGLKGCLDSSFAGDLSVCKVMSDYKTAQEWHSLSSETCLNYSFKIFSPSLCSVVCPSGSHGTHVAGIAAAYHPEMPDKNGVAPGAQILSIKIGDSRLDTLETQAGLVRAIRACVQAGAHIANYSYGEPCRYALKGAIARELKEAFLNKQLLFVTSAGNSGPALTTVGAPASLTDYVMSVGAFAAPSTHCPIYSMRAEVPEVHYTWSSRGPTQDGAQGVAVSAPGVAITAVPTATLQNNQLMNGTSMASPSAAGSVAVALSSLPDPSDHMTWSPASVKRAFMNAARKVTGAEKEAEGAGLIQVAKTVETLKGADQTHYNLKTAGGQRGVYLREPHEVATKQVIPFTVKAEHADTVSNEQKVSFEKHCLIKNSCSWITAPKFLHLSSGEKAFSIEVDPTQVAPGSYRSVRLDVVESGAAHKVLFNIPVTVVRPKELSTAMLETSHHFEPGEIKRDFLRVPAGATWCSVSIECVDEPGRYMFHAVQLQRGRPFVELNEELFVALNPKNAAKNFSFKVVGDGTLELTLARFWSSDGNGGARWRVHFGGCAPSQPKIQLSSAPTHLELVAAAPEMLSPAVRLEKLCTPLAPADHTVQKLDELPYDVPLDASLTSYRVRINYTFSLSAKTDIWLEVPLLNGLLYESDFLETLLHVLDANNKMVHTAEVLKFNGTKQTLEKGEYKLVVYLASTDKNRLDNLGKSLAVNLYSKLAKVIKADTYWSQEDAVLGKNKNKDKMLRAKEPLSLYVAPVSASDLDQSDLNQTAGRTLCGTMKLSKSEQTKKTENYEVSMTLLPKQKAKKDTPTKAPKDNSIAHLEKEERVKWVKEGHGGEEHFNNCKTLYPDHVPLYHARLQFLTKDAKEGSPVTSAELEAVCGEICTLVDIKNALFESMRKGKLTPDETKVRDAAADQKAAWTLAKVALARKMAAEFKEPAAEIGDGAGGEHKEALMKLLRELQHVTDWTTENKDAQILKMNIEIGRALQLPGWELKNILKMAESSNSKELATRIGDVYSAAGWQFAENYQRLSISENFPAAQFFV